MKSSTLSVYEGDDGDVWVSDSNYKDCKDLLDSKQKICDIKQLILPVKVKFEKKG